MLRSKPGTTYTGLRIHSIVWMFALSLTLTACVEQDDAISLVEHTYIFWTSIGDAAIMRAVMDTETNRIISIDTLYNQRQGVNAPSSIAVDEESKSIYWTDYDTRQVIRGTWDGQEPLEVLYTTNVKATGPVEISFDKRTKYLYWTHPFENIILRAPVIKNGKIDTLFTQADGINGAWGISLQVNEGFFYWIEYADVELHKSTIGNPLADLLLYSGGSGFIRPFGLSIASDVLYIVDNPPPGAGVGDRILRGSNDGLMSLSTVYEEDVQNAYNIVYDVDHNLIYWLNQLERGGIWQGSANGATRPVEVIPDIRLGQGLSIVHVKTRSVIL